MSDDIEKDGVILKAFNGDRSLNLIAITDCIEFSTKMPRTNASTRKILDCCEQLRAIADELKPKTKG